MKYCTYKTTYTGHKLPSFYVGSSSVSKVNNGYKGSVSSQEYKETWEQELRENPHLFETEILTLHEEREEATREELRFQKENDVVKSKDWINKSFAKPNGFFGMDVSGENNPMYGSTRKGEKHKGGENISSALKQTYQTEWGDKKKEQSSKRFKENNPTSNPETMKKMKEIWKKNGRGIGEKNGMFGKTGRLKGKKLYNNGYEVKAFEENKQPDGWIAGRIKNIK